MTAMPNALLVDICGKSFTIFSDDNYLIMIVNGRAGNGEAVLSISHRQ
jgi:hypothetical protein